MTFLGSVMVLVHLLVPFVASEYTTIVETSSGPMIGRIAFTVNNVTYASFIGIRYAEPPIGKLRFQPPVAIKPWKETAFADHSRPMCPQGMAGGGTIGSEDCLYLNVYTPVTNLNEIPTVRKSVMVWIHEGSFTHGSGNMDMRQPDFLLEKDIVFVSMNYRLGPLGFLSLNHREATGNQGLKDQKLALEWVQKNIEKFGGDPQSVTIFGKEAGAASVGYHVLSDASKGLFHAAIFMDGTPLAPASFVSPLDAAKRGEELARLLAQDLLSYWWTKRTSLDILYSMDIRMMNAAATYIDRDAAFLPTVEDPAKATDVFLSNRPIHKYRSGKFNKVPQLLGITQPNDKQYPYDKKKFLALIKKEIKRIRMKNGKNPEVLCLIKKLTKRYGHGSGEKHDLVVVTAEYATFDMLVNSPMQETRTHLAQHITEGDVYYYEFLPITKVPPSTSENNSNTNDLDSIFYVQHHNDSQRLTSSVADNVLTMWTNFAKFRNPTPYPLAQDSSIITWLPWGGSKQGLVIGTRVRMEVLPTNILFDRNAVPYDRLWRNKKFLFQDE